MVNDRHTPWKGIDDEFLEAGRKVLRARSEIQEELEVNAVFYEKDDSPIALTLEH